MTCTNIPSTSECLEAIRVPRSIHKSHLLRSLTGNGNLDKKSGYQLFKQCSGWDLQRTTQNTKSEGGFSRGKQKQTSECLEVVRVPRSIHKSHLLLRS
jgi:hypothetical protein